jgi:hypothetical protein
MAVDLLRIRAQVWGDKDLPQTKEDESASDT